MLVFVDSGSRQWTTTGFGCFLLLAYSPRLALFRLRWCVTRVAGGATTAAAGVNVRLGVSEGRASVTMNWIVACHGVSVGPSLSDGPFIVISRQDAETSALAGAQIRHSRAAPQARG